jgi:serine/threonine-protein kinase
VKVIDFGLATASNRLAPRTQAGLLKGKLEYMAPEQALGYEIDRRADVWAMGVCLYEMLAERLPFTADNQLDLARRITTGAPAAIEGLAEPIRQLLIGALARDPEERFESAAAMRKRCELTISAMDLPSTSEDVAAFVETHLSERTARRAETVARALEDAAGRPGNSTPPPVGVRVSARATLDPEAFKEAATPHRSSSSGGLTGATAPQPATSRRAWLLPAALITVILGFSAVGILKRVKATAPPGEASASATLSVVAPSIPSPALSASHTANVLPVTTVLDAGALVVAPSSRPLPMPASTRPRSGPVQTTAPTAPTASASAPPTATWGKIPPTVPIILPTTPTEPTP